MSNKEEFIKEYNKFVITRYSEPFPLIIVKGNGVYLTDIEGKEYLDFWAGIATVNAGHNNPKIQEAVRKQMNELVHCSSQSYYTIPALELAKKIATIAPFQPCKTTFHTSGSEAIDVAIKMVRRYTKRHEILALQGCYHGRTYGAHSIGTPVSVYSKSYVMGPYAPGVVHVPAPYCYRCSLGYEYPRCNIQCAKMIEDIINFGSSRDIAAFIAEPILGVGGIVTPPDEYFQEVKKILDKFNIPFISDEVQTGFGRTGRMWGIETYNVKPDLMVLAKALGNGWPISAVVAHEQIGDSLEPGDHFSTWGANPVMCAAASATIDYIVENRLWENAKKMGELLMKRLKEMESKYDIIGEVRGKGLMIGVEIVKDKRTKEPLRDKCKEIRKRCADYGLVVGFGGFWANVIRIQPPLTIREEHVDKAMEAFERAVKEVKDM
ncbi:MAG: aspartate aminotransferase family protein [Nitrososphaerota archaeon]|nr:aspartate aminotransferase family protein [Nitrososphaerales archaeon]MDW8044373.1 aspartate aminotransferase family protein [Nitrososphaerota archaeon]